MQAAQEPESQLQAKTMSLKNIKSRLHGFFCLFVIITIAKYLARSNLRKQEFILAHSFGVQSWENVRKAERWALMIVMLKERWLTPGWIGKQERGCTEFCCLHPLPFCIQARTPARGVFPSTPGTSLISPVKLLWKHSFSVSHTHPEMCLQGYWNTSCLHSEH